MVAQRAAILWLTASGRVGFPNQKAEQLHETVHQRTASIAVRVTLRVVDRDIHPDHQARIEHRGEQRRQLGIRQTVG
jgi:hypothetical protein